MKDRNKLNIRIAVENALYENIPDDATIRDLKDVRSLLNEIVDDFISENEIKPEEDPADSKTKRKRRQDAMQRYFSYTKGSGNPCLEMPCRIIRDGREYTSFVNGLSAVLTTEPAKGMEHFTGPGKYFDISEIIPSDGKAHILDIDDIIDRAKKKGYKLKQSEIRTNKRPKYLLQFDGAYFKIGLLDASYSIISQNRPVEVLHRPKNSRAPLVIKNELGLCVICPYLTAGPMIKDKDIVVIRPKRG